MGRGTFDSTVNWVRDGLAVLDWSSQGPDLEDYPTAALPGLVVSLAGRLFRPPR